MITPVAQMTFELKELKQNVNAEMEERQEWWDEELKELKQNVNACLRK